MCSYNSSILYNLLPPGTHQQKPSPSCGSGPTGVDPLSCVGPSNSSTSSGSPTFETHQRFDSLLSSDDILPFSRPSLCLPPLRGTTASRPTQRLSAISSEYQNNIDYHTDSDCLRLCPSSSGVSSVALNEDLFSCLASVAQRDHRANELPNGENNGVAISNTMSPSHTNVPRNISTADGLFQILNSGDYVASLIGNGGCSQIVNGNLSSNRPLGRSGSSGCGFINDPLSLTMVEFLSNSCSFDRQFLSQQSLLQLNHSQQPPNSEFLLNQSHQSQCHLIMRDEQDSQCLIDGLCLSNNQMTSSPASVSSGRKRAFSNNTNLGAEARKRNRRRHEPTIAAAQAIVDASSSIDYGTGINRSCGISQRQFDFMCDEINFSGGKVSPDTAQEQLKTMENSTRRLQYRETKPEDLPPRNVDTDVEESSTRSSPPPAGLEDDQNITDDPIKLKVERKRARNRLAARRCRERKVSLIMSLEHQVSELNSHIKNLEIEVDRYRSEANQLRHRLNLLSESFPSLREELFTLSSQLDTSSYSNSSELNQQHSLCRPTLVNKPEQN